MYGFINTCLKSLVIEKFGEETWDKLRREAGVQDTFMTFEVYGDDITMRLLAEACRLLDVEPDVVLRQFGEYFFEFCKRSGYDHMLRTLGGNLYEFIENLDALHSYLSLSYKEMNAPSFRVEKNSNGTMVLHYYSIRRGLCHIVPGIIGAVAKDFFRIQIKMEILEQREEAEWMKKKEHIVFLVTQEPLGSNATRGKSNLSLAKPITNLSLAKPITNLSLAKPITNLSLAKPRRSSASHSPEPKHTQAGGEGAEGKWPTLRGPRGRSHWEMVRGLVHLGKGKLLRGFEPVYPESLCIDLQTFCNTFPYHLVFDQELRVRQAGVNIQRIVPGLQTRQIRLDQYFSILQPEVPFTIPSIRTFINSHFVLQTRRGTMPQEWSDRPMLELRGQMVWMSRLQCMLYQASPLLRSLQELEERRMHISDIAPHDVTRDLILLNQQRLAEMELSNQLERKKEELRHLSQHLEQEKHKTDALLYAMLPKHVANQLKEGKRVEAGEFKECTILFSDVVTFTNICSECEPIQIVFMLNSMYLKFDRLTTVHNVYKVETIGDAYMVVGGVPLPVSSHAERVANFALGMIIAARDVTNPITSQPIQIRVGMHSGPVLAGVVGEKMPRYCLFGDTVNTASRMESHGLPNRIHLSPSVYQALRGKGFWLQARGEIEVKGKGKMHTYFLEGNLRATDEQIMGWSNRKPDSGHESVQSGPSPRAHRALYKPRTQARDCGPAVPMKYGDSLTEHPPHLEPEPQPPAPSLAGNPRDSESYGSLQSDNNPSERNLSERNPVEVNPSEKNPSVKNPAEVNPSEENLEGGTASPAKAREPPRTRLCVVL